MWQPSLDQFLSDYLPVEKVTDSDKQFNTRDIQRMLQDHTGTDVDLNELYVALLDRGYTYASVGLEMEWLFRVNK